MAMSNHGGHDAGGPNPGHELRDINARRIVIFGAVLVVLVAVSMAAMKVTFDYFARREARNQPPPSTLAAHAPDQLPPEPRLQQNPLLDLVQLRAEEARQLTSFGWIDQPRGIVRIPVADAMKIAVKRGLPHRDAAAAASLAATTQPGGRP